MDEADMEPSRRIGWLGTVGRVTLGSGLLVAAVLVGPLGWLDVALGLVGFPAATTLILRIRGRHAPPLRFTGPGGHIANIAIAAALASVALQATLLFYGTAMLLAATYGYAGCELFAFANRLNGRDDEIGCPVFWPIDTIEDRTPPSR